MHPSDLLQKLAQFTGSETFTRHSLVRCVLMTEGVLFLAKEARAHWLTDSIASYLVHELVRSEPFQVWTLKVDPASRQGQLAMTDGNSSPSIVGQTFDYTDFPLGEITLWLVADGDNWVLMLPSEY